MAVGSSNRSASCFTDSSAYPQFFRCFDVSASFHMFVGFAFASLLLLPAYVSVVWTGLRRRRRRGPAASAARSRSDVFTYVMTTVDLVGVVGSLCFSVAVYTCSQWVKLLGYYVFSFTFPGQTFFHCLTCVERYLAVVGPVTARRLSLALGATLRHASVGGVLLLCLGSVALSALYFPTFPAAPLFVVFAVAMFVVLFCSLSVLRALVRLGPGKVGGRRVDRSKQRAFRAVLAITGALASRSFGLVLCTAAFDWQRSGTGWCVLLMSGLWMCLPSNLVLPVLFVHTAGKRRLLQPAAG